MVENIHMKQRTMGLTFVLKSREAKGRRIESQFKNTLNELLGDASRYGSEIVLRKLIMSQIALELAQNLGIDYIMHPQKNFILLYEKERYGNSY
jgi:hypothetical protein